MANLFANLPLPVLNGPGAAVPTDGMGTPKTIICEGDFDGATITVEASVDGGVGWAPVTVLSTGATAFQAEFSATHMRTNVSGRNPLVTFTASVEVGAPDSPASFIAIPMPAGVGSGAPVNIAAFGVFSTFIAVGSFAGAALRVEVSDDLVNWAPLVSFSGQGGLKNIDVTAQFARATVTGHPIAATLAMGAAANPASAGGVPTPPFTPTSVSIFARTTGDDAFGTGTLLNPYQTLQRAVRDVPLNMPPGTFYNVDITGITEVLPPNYTLPAWKAPWADVAIVGNQFEVIAKAVNIRATPQLVAAIPPADAVIAVTDILSVVAAAVSTLVTINLVVARPSWGGNALKGKQLVGAVGGAENCVIVASTASSITLAKNAAPTTPLQVMEPSATISGSFTGPTGQIGPVPGILRAINVDSVKFHGMNIFNTGGVALPSLAAAGLGSCQIEMCKVSSPTVYVSSTAINRIFGTWVQGAPLIGGYTGFFNSFGDALTGNGMFTFTTSAQLAQSVFDGCTPIEFANTQFPNSIANNQTPVGFVRGQNCIIKNTPGVTGDGILWHGAAGKLTNFDISGCGRDAIRCVLGSGLLQLVGCGTVGVANGVAAAGFGINTQDGMFTTADAATNTTNPGAGNGLRGGAGDTKTGNLATQTWAAFVAGGKNAYDITAVAAGGATGTGSRLYQ